ncbi:MAG: fibronectin-binding protein [bacterium]
MRKWLSLCCLAIVIIWAAPAAAQSANIEGTYGVLGTNPKNAGSYRGTATIVKSGDVYRVHWQVGSVYDGVGKLNGNTFAVEWGNQSQNVGTVTYTVQPDGNMKGTWFVAKNPNDLGTETLTRLK